MERYQERCNLLIHVARCLTDRIAHTTHPNAMLLCIRLSSAYFVVLLAGLLVFDLCHIRYGKNQRPTSSGDGQSSIHDDRFENVQIFPSFCSMCFDKMYDFHVAEILRR